MVLFLGFIPHFIRVGKLLQLRLAFTAAQHYFPRDTFPDCLISAVPLYRSGKGFSYMGYATCSPEFMCLAIG